jgi:hypothetical protein
VIFKGLLSRIGQLISPVKSEKQLFLAQNADMVNVPEPEEKS